ncbi:MAG: ROK family protein [Desulfuromonadaceae bacterium]|jgi:polyphosphate glucokinase|nr:ROK family protein [Desulfuromonadaceae bacterium]
MTSKNIPHTPHTRTLSIDVGGTALKASVLDGRGRMVVDSVRVDTPNPCPPKVLINALVELVKQLPEFDRVSIGFPGYVRDDKVITAPNFGNDIWHGFDLVKALKTTFSKPVRLLNDADMQGLAAIQGKGLELVVTLGTGVGTGWFRNGEPMPHLELSQHPVHKGKNYNEFIGNKALKKIGKKKWNSRVQQAITFLQELFHPDETYIGGGNSRKITFTLAAHVQLISNQDGILGGFRLWEQIKNANSR